MNKRKHKKSLDKSIKKRQHEITQLGRPVIKKTPCQIIKLAAVQEFSYIDMQTLPPDAIKKIMVRLLCESIEQYVEITKYNGNSWYEDTIMVEARIEIAKRGETVEYDASPCRAEYVGHKDKRARRRIGWK